MQEKMNRILCIRKFQPNILIHRCVFIWNKTKLNNNITHLAYTARLTNNTKIHKRMKTRIPLQTHTHTQIHIFSSVSSSIFFSLSLSLHHFHTHTNKQTCIHFRVVLNACFSWKHFANTHNRTEWKTCITQKPQDYTQLQCEMPIWREDSAIYFSRYANATTLCTIGTSMWLCAIDNNTDNHVQI